MNNKKNIPDHVIHAFLDDELGDTECSQLLEAAAKDHTLAWRIDCLRALKEQTHADSLHGLDLDHPTRRRGWFGTAAFRTLAAGLLLAVGFTSLWWVQTQDVAPLSRANQLISKTQPVSIPDIRQVIGDHDRVIVHITRYDETRFRLLLDQLEKLLDERSDESTLIVDVVAEQAGVNALTAGNARFASRIQKLTDRYKTLRFFACGKTMAEHVAAGNPVQLANSVAIAQSGAHQVAMRSGENWLYIKAIG